MTKPTFTNEDLFREAVAPLWDRRQSLESLEGEDTLEALQDFSKPQKLMFALAELDAEGGGGGWDSFVRVSGYLLPLLVEALRSIGPREYLARAEEILAGFPAGAVTNSRKREESWEARFGERAESLTEEFFQMYEANPIRPCAEEYIQAHIAEFFARMRLQPVVPADRLRRRLNANVRPHEHHSNARPRHRAPFHLVALPSMH